MRKKLYIMCGAPASGKTSYVQTHASRGTSAHISRDKIRFQMIEGHKPYFSKEKAVYKEYIKQIQMALTSPWVEEVYADATQIDKKSRLRLIRSLGKLIEEVDIYTVDFSHISYLTSSGRNEQRTGLERVPNEVIFNMYKKYTDPRTDGVEYEKIIWVKE